MDEYISMARVWELTCPGFPNEIARARRWIRDVLSGHPRAEDAALVATELGTNALLHTTSGTIRHGIVGLTVVLIDQAVVIAVTDNGGGSTTPHLAHPTTQDPHGRGLALVTALSDYVQITGDPTTGHTVTAHLTRTPTDRLPTR